MIFIGIDWSTQHDDICIMDEKGKKIKEFRIPVSSSGFSNLLKLIEEIEPDKNEVSIGIETDKNILADFLLASGYRLYNLNPLSVSRFKERYKTSGKKDDKFDAFNIASILFSDRNNFKPIVLSSNECRNLQVHCQSVDNFIRQRSRLTNKLNSELLRYFPAFSIFFSNLSSNIPLNILQSLSRPSEVANMSESEFEIKVRDVKYFNKKRKADFFRFLKSEVIIFDNPLEEAFSEKVVYMAKQILLINDTIEYLENLIEHNFDNHKDSKIFKSIPGLNYITISKGRQGGSILLLFVRLVINGLKFYIRCGKIKRNIQKLISEIKGFYMQLDTCILKNLT